MAREWADSTLTNNGVILWATNEDVNGRDLRFASRERSNAEIRPVLRVAYVANDGSDTINDCSMFERFQNECPAESVAEAPPTQQPVTGAPMTGAPTAPPPTFSTGTPTPGPTTAPTAGPTAAPTPGPTRHACDNGSHDCDPGEHGVCTPLIASSTAHRCGCASTHSCSDGDCGSVGHTCVLITGAPTSAPTASAPTEAPTAAPPTEAPTEASTASALTDAPTDAPPPQSASDGGDDYAAAREMAIIFGATVVVLAIAFIALVFHKRRAHQPADPTLGGAVTTNNAAFNGAVAAFDPQAAYEAVDSIGGGGGGGVYAVIDKPDAWGVYEVVDEADDGKYEPVDNGGNGDGTAAPDPSYEVPVTKNPTYVVASEASATADTAEYDVITFCRSVQFMPGSATVYDTAA